jgi:hypothetical protein
MDRRDLTVPSAAGDLGAELLRPADAAGLLILAHGAGAGFRHASMTGISEALAARGVATLRFNFPFMEAGRRRVDVRPVAVAAVVEAARAGARHAPDLPLFLGGHSFGGRMASHAVAEGRVSPRGLICLSFPLHPADRPGVARAAHLDAVGVPVLFLSGTRDALADPELLAGVVARLGSQARLHWLEDADHGYRVRKRVRQDTRPVFGEIAEEAAAFVALHAG